VPPVDGFQADYIHWMAKKVGKSAYVFSNLHLTGRSSVLSSKQQSSQKIFAYADKNAAVFSTICHNASRPLVSLPLCGFQCSTDSSCNFGPADVESHWFAAIGITSRSAPKLHEDLDQANLAFRYSRMHIWASLHTDFCDLHLRQTEAIEQGLVENCSS